MDSIDRKRAVLDRKHELKYAAALDAPGVKGVGKRILERAIGFDRSRRNRSVSESGQIAKDAATMACRRIRGTTPVNDSSFVSGFGPGVKLGAGRWRQTNGKWERVK